MVVTSEALNSDDCFVKLQSL